MGLKILTKTSGSPWLVPPLPTPITGFTFIPTISDAVPHKGTLIDNVRFPTSPVGTFVGKLLTSTIWTVAHTDLHANVDGFVGAGRTVWYDDVNDRLYIWGLDTNTTPDTLYTAYVTLETGAVTNVGNVHLGTNFETPTSENNTIVQRAAVDSGNFTLQCKDRVIVINASTGAEVSNVSAVAVTTGTYSTQEGSTFLGLILSTEVNNYATIVKDRVVTVIPMPLLSIGDNITLSHNVSYIRWGSEVRAFASVSNRAVFRAFPLADFDKWVEDLAAIGGL